MLWESRDDLAGRLSRAPEQVDQVFRYLERALAGEARRPAT